MKKKRMLIVILLVATVLVCVGVVFSFSQKNKEESDSMLGLWRLDIYETDRGFMRDYRNEKYSDTYCHFTADKMTIYRLSKGTVVARTERYYRSTHGTLQVSKSDDFKKSDEYDLPDVVKETISFDGDVLRIVEHSVESAVTTGQYRKVDSSLTAELDRNFAEFLKTVEEVDEP